jgi:hypothetical protein
MVAGAQQEIGRPISGGFLSQHHWKIPELRDRNGQRATDGSPGRSHQIFARGLMIQPLRYFQLFFLQL